VTDGVIYITDLNFATACVFTIIMNMSDMLDKDMQSPTVTLTEMQSQMKTLHEELKTLRQVSEK